MKITFFSAGKSPERNEDFYGFSETSFVVADGATDKSGLSYDGKTGGEIASRAVVETCLSSELTGAALVRLLNEKIADLHRSHGAPAVATEPKNRFTCSFVAARLTPDKLVVTSVGDSGFRINGRETHRDVKRVDVENSAERARHIAATGDVAGARTHILPLLLQQFSYQNNADNALGYGVIDGTATPERFIRTYVFRRAAVKTLEIFSDGYFALPTGTTTEDWEESHRLVELEDPDKWKKYPSTKSRDDRTVLIVDFAG